MPYLLLLPVVAMTLSLWVIGRLLAPGWRTLLPGRGRALVAGLALATADGGAVSRPRRSRSPAPMTAMRPSARPATTPTAGSTPTCRADARILTNAYTDGALAAVAHRVGIVDGRAVYLENPTFLAESTALCLGARVVFGDTGRAWGRRPTSIASG